VLEIEGVSNPAIYTTALTKEQASALLELMKREGFEFEERQYMLGFGKKGKLTVAVYEKGPKAVVQGKETADFVTFYLEPEILGEARLGYEEVHNPEMFAPHFGIDESGKGDFFGPLVIAGVYVDPDVARDLRSAGVTDSKRIGSDKRIRELAAVIRKTRTPQTLITISPERYNSLIDKMGNVNRVLAWGHARAIENLCELRPDCPRALSDKFADVRVLERALMEKGRKIQLDQRTKAESDPAVAAASILARERFINWMDDAGQANGLKIPRGASAATKEAARTLVASRGPEHLATLVKMHFRTSAEVIFGKDDARPESGDRRPER
jgi:ribonuclease HIII